MKNLYENPDVLAYDLRNFMGIEGLAREEKVGLRGDLKNGEPNSSLLFKNGGETDFYKKVYSKIVGKDYVKFYKNFQSLVDTDTKWNNIFDWINSPKVGSSTESTIEKTDIVVENDMAKFLGVNTNSAKYIQTVFTILPKILKGDDLSIADGRNSTNTTLDRSTINTIRRTFKEAINSLNSMKGGKKTHKLKIKKRKTYKRKSFRHKTRNAINRL